MKEDATQIKLEHDHHGKPYARKVGLHDERALVLN